jgi:hypothetical protein
LRERFADFSTYRARAGVFGDERQVLMLIARGAQFKRLNRPGY